MTAHTEMDLTAMENRLNAVRMTESDRAAALSALRKGAIIVDGVTWLVRRITLLGESLSSRPGLAR